MVIKEEENKHSLDLFLKIGLDERTAQNTLANAKVTANLVAVIHEVFGVLRVQMISFQLSIYCRRI